MDAIIRKFGIASVAAVLGLSLSAVALGASQGLFIGASGHTHLTGQVTANANSTLLVQSFLGTWVVNVSDATMLNVAKLSDVHIGDTVFVVGTLGKGMSIDSKTITDITANASHNNISATDHMSGTIGAINATARTFALTKKNGESLNVVTNANTQVFLNGTLSTFIQLSNGNKAKVSGTFDTTTNVLTAEIIRSSMTKIGEDNENAEATGKDNAKIHVELNHNLNAHANAWGLFKIGGDENGKD